MKYYSLGGYSMRPVGEADLPRLTHHRNDESTWSGLTDVMPKYYHDQLKWLNSMGDRNLYFIVGWSDSEIGLARITDIDFTNSNACVGLDIFSEYRNLGHSRFVFGMIVSYCFKVLNLYRLWLLVKEDNKAAIKTYRRTGFIEEGRMRQHLYRDGRYYDYIMMGLLENEWVNFSI